MNSVPYVYLAVIDSALQLVLYISSCIDVVFSHLGPLVDGCDMDVHTNLPRCFLFCDDHVQGTVDWFIEVHVLDYFLPSREVRVLGQ